jgi:hypothetical protein
MKFGVNAPLLKGTPQRGRKLSRLGAAMNFDPDKFRHEIQLFSGKLR